MSAPLSGSMISTNRRTRPPRLIGRGQLARADALIRIPQRGDDLVAALPGRAEALPAGERGDGVLIPSAGRLLRRAGSRRSKVLSRSGPAPRLTTSGGAAGG